MHCDDLRVEVRDAHRVMLTRPDSEVAMSEQDAIVRSPNASPAVSDSDTGAVLDSVDRMITGTVSELSRMLDTKQVVGEPMTIGNSTVIPLVSLGFGFGAGGGGGGTAKTGEQGSGGGGGGGGGIKPVGVIIIDEDGVRLARVPDKPSGLDRLGDAITNAVERRKESGGDED